LSWSDLFVEETGVRGDNHIHAANNWYHLVHNVVGIFFGEDGNQSDHTFCVYRNVYACIIALKCELLGACY